MLTLDTIMKDSVWVAKMQGWREAGTLEEIGHLSDDPDCRDFDLCAKQPEHLDEFFEAYWKHDGFITIQDFYNKFYAPEKSRRIWTEEEIKTLVQTNDTVLYRALKKLYDCQTEGERLTKQTRDQNGKGFNSVDGEFLSNVSEFLISRGYLTPKQKAIVRKKLVKYTKQLTRLANA